MNTPLLVGTVPDLDALADALNGFIETLAGRGLTWDIHWSHSEGMWRVLVADSEQECGDDYAVAHHRVLLEACRTALASLRAPNRVVEE